MDQLTFLVLVIFFTCKREKKQSTKKLLAQNIVNEML